jgi:hypothetical protein
MSWEGMALAGHAAFGGCDFWLFTRFATYVPSNGTFYIE